MPLEPVKDTDERCELVIEEGWKCIYYCPRSGEIVQTRRIPQEMSPPANDVCPREIRLTD